jgi:hypothetical protein
MPAVTTSTVESLAATMLAQHIRRAAHRARHPRALFRPSCAAATFEPEMRR